eukprot:CAMPEP_0178418944 /NCGR_PEP_ID=MMETSP0689_2-20121128/25350_1 /TAXON_ID=160604 /ORGANISM="Amphidinium massartii, Strain CS-259" /LENGTH=191 /DNA_ID=CAMNT_0020040355 /DNA_START=9 /DNA_END=584 /DNA_ORIENTATION=+
MVFQEFPTTLHEDYAAAAIQDHAQAESAPGSSGHAVELRDEAAVKALAGRMTSDVKTLKKGTSSNLLSDNLVSQIAGGSAPISRSFALGRQGQAEAAPKSMLRSSSSKGLTGSWPLSSAALQGTGSASATGSAGLKTHGSRLSSGRAVVTSDGTQSVSYVDEGPPPSMRKKISKRIGKSLERTFSYLEHRL